MPKSPRCRRRFAFVCRFADILAKRADFLRAAQARRQGTPAFLLQARARGDDSPTVRVGYTCSKKIGNAVARNRAKRRLREVARAVLPGMARPGWDYVLVGRPGCDDRPELCRLADRSGHRARAGSQGRAPK